MRKLRPAIVAAVCALGTVTMLSTASAWASPGQAGHPASAAAGQVQNAAVRSNTPVLPEKPTNCPSGDFCSYNVANGTSPCVEQSSGNHNWNSPCKNEDASIINISSGKTRLYYNASGWNAGTSAWMCINSGDYIDNLLQGDSNPHNQDGAYVFDQGPGGSGHGLYSLVWHNVASDSIVSGSCNPNE